MKLYTIGFKQKSAEEFFQLVLEKQIEILIDIRVYNEAQLAGFAKGRDLEYFLKKMCNCKYEHNMIYAPEKKLLKSYKKKEITWKEFKAQYNELVMERKMPELFTEKHLDYDNVLILCSELTPRFCYRRLLAEKLQEELSNVDVIHL